MKEYLVPVVVFHILMTDLFKLCEAQASEYSSIQTCRHTEINVHLQDRR